MGIVEDYRQNAETFGIADVWGLQAEQWVDSIARAYCNNDSPSSADMVPASYSRLDRLERNPTRPAQAKR